MEKVTRGINTFALRLHYLIAQDNEDENVCLSPFSAYASLAIIYLGARGKTAEQLADALGLNSKSTSKVHEICAWLWFLLHRSGSKTQGDLFLANQLFLHPDIDIRMDFDQYAEAYYNTIPVSLDFISRPEGCRRRINSWTERKTGGNIDELIEENGIKETLAILSVNVAFFRGLWRSEFPPTSIFKGEFAINQEEVIPVDMMYKEDALFYGNFPGLFCEVLFLPLLWTQGWMTIVLPYQNGDLVTLEYRLGLLNNFKTFRKRVKKCLVSVTLPQFRVERSYDLATALAMLGMKDLIKPGETDLSAMVETPPFPISVTEMRHKAGVDVTNKGSTQTQEKTRLNCMSKTLKKVDFMVNRPFLFFVQDGITRTVIFSGHIVRPCSEEKGVPDTSV